MACLLTGCVTSKVTREGVRVDVENAVTAEPVKGAMVELIFNPEESDYSNPLTAFGQLLFLPFPKEPITLTTSHTGRVRLPTEREDIDFGIAYRAPSRVRQIKVSADGYQPFTSPPDSEWQVDPDGGGSFSTPEFWESYPRLKVQLEPLMNAN